MYAPCKPSEDDIRVRTYTVTFYYPPIMEVDSARKDGLQCVLHL